MGLLAMLLLRELRLCFINYQMALSQKNRTLKA